MKRIQYHRYGGPEQMRLEDYKLPNLGKHEILVNVKAAAINPLDWKVRNGMFKYFMLPGFPRAMGVDLSGVVESVGAAVKDFSVGDEVLGQARSGYFGAFAEKCITNAKLIVKKPASLPFEQAAALPTVGITAWRALVLKGGVTSGKTVFINGAYGSVGQAAVRIALAFGALVTMRVGPNDVAAAKAMGADQVCEYTQELPANLHKKFDIVFDCHGSLSAAQQDFLAKSKAIVIDINPTAKKFIKSLFAWRYKIVIALPNREILQKIVDLKMAGKLEILLGSVAKLDDAVQLITDKELAKKAKGKAVIVI